tara:strand:+ start:522 stop:1010 length:489 start_codon:yes stop_codon:yes gene_type:complete
MPEAYGIIIIKSNEAINNKFIKEGDVRGATLDLIEFAGLDSKVAKSMDFDCGEISQDSGYLSIDPSQQEWVKLALYLGKKGENIEIYARTEDEYGQGVIVALDKHGNRFNFIYQGECDEMEDEDFDEDAYEESINSKTKEWEAMVPNQVKASFPSLIPSDEE